MGAREVIRIPADWFECYRCGRKFDTALPCFSGDPHEWKWAGVKRG